MPVYFISGGAGFMGSHLTKKVLNEEGAYVIVYDNFSSGRMQYLKEVKDNMHLKIVKADIKEFHTLALSMKNADVVYHFASNPDIAKAIAQPDIDFWEGTYLTNNILEAMRVNNVKKLLYASGSGVYGEAGLTEIREDHSPMLPVSTYGASKLASEALICSYCSLFDMNASALRFANIVGPHQTHGVGFDFIHKLLKTPSVLEILGDGNQSKSYIYVTDAIEAMRLVEKNAPYGFSYYNVATLDYLTVKEIADIVVDVLALKDVRYVYTGGRRGWKGDVPIVRLNSEKIRVLGWKNRCSSKEAAYLSIRAICEVK
jgi:UDP-glucose 4-epimerase